MPGARDFWSWGWKNFWRGFRKSRGHEFDSAWDRSLTFAGVFLWCEDPVRPEISLCLGLALGPCFITARFWRRCFLVRRLRLLMPSL